ncbi:MAG: glyoxalase superfamily protein [Pseudomonadota bacterium]
MPPSIATRDQAKAYARLLRAQCAAEGQHISHSAALERVAQELGHADWNTLSARLSNKPERPLRVGDWVEGQYLKRPITGCVKAVREIAMGRAFDVTLDLDEPVDVVDSEWFSNLRRQITLRISADGLSFDKTSDGVPHLFVSASIPANECV